jgi:hypothetical protein
VERRRRDQRRQREQNPNRSADRERTTGGMPGDQVAAGELGGKAGGHRDERTAGERERFEQTQHHGGQGGTSERDEHRHRIGAVGPGPKRYDECREDGRRTEESQHRPEEHAHRRPAQSCAPGAFKWHAAEPPGYGLIQLPQVVPAPEAAEH